MSARRRRGKPHSLGSGIGLVVFVAAGIAFGWYRSRSYTEDKSQRAAEAADRKADNEAYRLRTELSDHERTLMKLALDLSLVRVHEEVPCPMQLGEVFVGQQPWLGWIALGRHGDRGDAPGSQSLPFDHAANRIGILHPNPAQRAKELGALLKAPYLGIAIPTQFVQARRAPEAPGFTGGTFSGYLAIYSMRDAAVVCSAKLHVQITTVGTNRGYSGGAELDDHGNWQTWNQVFHREATTALRRIGGPLAAMAE